MIVLLTPFGTTRKILVNLGQIKFAGARASREDGSSEGSTIHFQAPFTHTMDVNESPESVFALYRSAILFPYFNDGVLLSESEVTGILDRNYIENPRHDDVPRLAAAYLNLLSIKKGV